MTIKTPQYPSLTRRGFIARVAAALSVSPFEFPSLNYAETKLARYWATEYDVKEQR